MPKKMDLNELDIFFDRGIDFELTPGQYMASVGKALPQRKQSIVGSNAPLRRKATEKGFDIRVEKREVTQMIVIFTKRRTPDEKEN